MPAGRQLPDAATAKPPPAAKQAKLASLAAGVPPTVSMTPPLAASGPAASTAAPHVSGAAASVGEAAASAPPSSSAAARDGASADSLRDYRMALAIEARRFKRYPPLARERGWQGTAEAAVTGSSVGAPLVSLQRSSGHAALDEQTLDMVRRATLATPLPEALRGRDFRVLLPVRFSLDDDQ